MASTKAPLFGLDASGSLAKSIVFSKWKGRTYVRRHSVPANPQSPLQVSMRAMFKFLTQHWKTLDAANQAPYIALAAEKQTTPLNEFIAFNQQRHRFNLSPSIEDPATDSGTAPDAPATFTAGDGRLSSDLAWTAGANAPDFGWAISMSTSVIATMSVNDMILIVPSTTLAARISPLLAGTTYHFQIRGFMATGKTGAHSPDTTATPIP